MRSTAEPQLTTGTLAQRLQNLSPAKRALLEKKLGKTVAPAEPFQIKPRADASSAPLSFNQEGMLFMEQLEPGTPKYNVYEAIRIDGRLDIAILRQALDQIVDRHQTLRTTFAEIDGVWQQIVGPRSDSYFRHLELGDNDEPVAMLQAEADRPIDIFNGPIFSTLLLTRGRTESYLIVKVHHIVSDGWSLGIFWKEFAQVYSALAAGRVPHLHDLPVQYGDYSSWSREYLQRELDRQTNYWKAQLSGAPAVLEVPADRPRPAVQTARGSQESVVLPPRVLAAINDLCKAEGCTIYVALLAAFDALLSRYTGSRDLVVGTPIAGRTRTEIEDVIGYFVNTLALRTDLSGDPSFSEILDRVRSTVLDAFSHQELPFEKVVAALKPERSLSHNPIYQVAFALQEASRSAVDLEGLRIEQVPLQLSTSKFDLFLSAREATDGLRITVEYSTDLFDRETILRFIGHYRNLLEAATAAPQTRLSELNFLSDDERRQLIMDWNQTATEYPKRSLQDLFALHCSDTPEAVALQTLDRQWTYSELDEWSDRLANFLTGLGVSAGDRVGVSMDRCPLMIAAILALLKCGAAYVPMDPANPASRLEQMISDAELAIILTGVGSTDTLPQDTARIVDLVKATDDIASCAADFRAVTTHPDDVACVLYTSGSTGRPKGALITHKSISRLVINTNYVDLSDKDRVAHVSNVAFDGALFDIWGGLLNGGTVVVMEKDLVLSPSDFAAALKSTGVTTMFLTSSLFHLMSRERPDAFSTLKTVIAGGEAFEPAAARRLFEAGAPQRILNGYGPTESTTFSTWKLIDRDTAELANIPIGRPLSNTTIYILDEHFNPVPVGVPGEIFIGGDGLALGYLNRPELNAERFTTVSIDVPGVGWCDVKVYRTGDIGRYKPNGDVEYMGRKDHQVKVRGFRMELGEIEAVIESHERVAEAVVLAIKDEHDHRLIAYYVASDGATLPHDELREFLRGRLPHYMVPASLVELDKMPLNRNGKVDRQKLAREATFEDANDTHHDAADELQVKLLWIWQRVLGIHSIGVRDNFFDLGGHSLAAVKVFAEIERSLGCRLPISTLFKAPTIEQLSELISGGSWRSSWRSLVPVRTSGGNPPFFCVHAVGGNILEYNDLAASLSPEQPFYGLQSLGLDGGSPALTDIGEMADAYLSEIREVQPNGPYYLGGRSFGGTVAYEMARRLRAAGEEVTVLAIFDSYPKNWLKLLPEEEAARYRNEFRSLRAKRHLAIWGGLGLMDKFRYGWTKLGYKSRKIKHFIWRASQRFRSDSTSVTSTVRDIEEINYQAVRNYIPEKYDGRVTFFSAKEEVCPEENLAGWGLLALRGVDVIEVPGDHQTMIKPPHVSDLATRLEETIRATVAVQPTTTGVM